MEELLRNAAARGDCKQVTRLLAEKVKSTPDESGRNALHLAAAGGFQDVVAALLQAKWDVNLQDTAGCTALQKAAAEGHVEVLHQLIKHGANVNIQDKVHGNTALHEASWKGYSKCVQELCQAPKVSLQIKNAGGFAPLHLACQNGHNQSCRELLMANCNPNVQNNYGDTPLHTSARYGHAGVTRILISADCHMSDQNKNGDTALHITAAMGRRKLTRILLEAGCDPNKRNKQNERAKDIAIRKDLNEIIEIIDNTIPVKKKDREREKKEKVKEMEKKRGKDSGSSKDSNSRPKDKKKPRSDHQVHFDGALEAKWSPYGCHYYPDSKTFPKPKLDSLPQEPLKKGEQYFLDLAGNIRKGPVGIGYTCYCAPFFRHMEERLDRDKKELKQHIDAAQILLDKKVTNLEVQTRTQLNEITRTMALERAKCQQRHLHLEQWLIRGSVFRHSDKPRASLPFPHSASIPAHAPLPKARSLENILEERPPPNDDLRRSVDILNDHLGDYKNRSSSREGKESGKGSSDVGDIGTSEEEREREAEGVNPFARQLSVPEKHERRIRRTTREISERIDQVLQHQDGGERLDVLCDEMVKWRNYRGSVGQWASEDRKENQIMAFHHTLTDSVGMEQQSRQPTHLRGTVEEPERRSVREIVSKMQKQHTVQELVAKIQKKTGLIHKSAQKWKENKLKGKGKKYSGDGKEESEAENEKSSNSLPNYENVHHWRHTPQQNLSHLPYRCRSTVYSPGNLDSYAAIEYQRKHSDPDLAPRDPNLNMPNTELQSDHAVYNPHEELLRNAFGSVADITDHFYGSCREDDIDLNLDPTKSVSLQPPHNYSPTQNDSGYSTKPYGGSSTGPSPSLSGQDYDCASADTKPPLPPSTHKTLQATTSSLV